MALDKLCLIIGIEELMITTIAVVTSITYVSALTVAYRISRKKHTKK